MKKSTYANKLPLVFLVYRKRRSPRDSTIVQPEGVLHCVFFDEHPHITGTNFSPEVPYVVLIKKKAQMGYTWRISHLGFRLRGQRRPLITRNY